MDAPALVWAPRNNGGDRLADSRFEDATAGTVARDESAPCAENARGASARRRAAHGRRLGRERQTKKETVPAYRTHHRSTSRLSNVDRPVTAMLARPS